MADLTPGELARIDQIHSAVMGKLAELISSAIDGIRAEGEAQTASALAGTAQGTDHASVSALLAAALIRCARHAMADEKRKDVGEQVRADTIYEVRDWTGTDYDGMVSFTEKDCTLESIEHYATNQHEANGYTRTVVTQYEERVFRTAERIILELGTKPEAAF